MILPDVMGVFWHESLTISLYLQPQYIGHS